MQLHEYPGGRAHADPLRARIGRLIEVVGTARFEPEMFGLTRSVLDCEHVTAFAVSEAIAPRILFAANMGPLPIAKMLAAKYVTQYWRFDPANRIPDATSPGTKNIAISTVPNDISDGSYRRDCYTSVGLRDRFSVMRRGNGETIRINFYRGARGGTFDTTAIDFIMGSADLLLSLILKHARDGETGADRLTPRQCQDRLRMLEPAMPLREIEVCAAIIQGMTSEAISLKLGISVNTVLTYRKRAYARLGISCQNELMRLVLS
jgi:DNA-binding CsgD family transcriptional regulator